MPIVPLQVDAASGPEQVISQKALETGARSLRRERLARPPPPSDVLDLLGSDRALPGDGDLPAAVHQQRPGFRRLDARPVKRPRPEAVFGYDAQGYDVYTRTVYGARASVTVGILATAFCLVFGCRGRHHCRIPRRMARFVIGRFAEIFLAIPLLLGGILFLYTFPNQVDTPFAVAVGKVAFVIAILAWPTITRMMRSSVLQVKPNDYVQAARALGASPLRIINSHILPNSLASVIVVSTINLGVFISLEASLSFLGVGLQPPVISWGNMISDASGHRADPDCATHAAVSQPVPVADCAVLHHAGRRRSRRPRSETSLRRPP